MPVKVKNSTKGKRNPPRVRLARQEQKSEISLIGQALRAIGSAGGGVLGGMLGSSGAGAAAGNNLGAAVSRWIGAGDYSVGSNSIVKQTRASPHVPMMHSQNQTITVRHKEYLMQVTSSTGFAVTQAFTLNPGLEATFPWLSNIARNYQEYSIKGAVFHYVPTSGNAISGTNNALGSVMMQTTYRSTDSPPVSKVELLNEYWACESIPSESFCHPIECDPKENPFNIQYVRTGTVPAGDSKLIYDLGTTYVATSGQQTAGVVLGDIWITYEVELRKPILFSNATFQNDRFSATYGGTLTSSSVFTSLLGTYGALPITAAVNTITIPKGQSGMYIILVRIVTDASPLTNAVWKGVSTLTNCESVVLFYGESRIETDNTTTTGTKANQYGLQVLKDDPNVIATVTLPNPTAATGGYSACYLTVWRVNY